MEEAGVVRVLFWGTPEFALPTLLALGEEGHDVVGVVTQPDRPVGRGRKPAPSPIKRAALAEGMPVFQPERARGAEFEHELRGLAADISVVVAFGQILPERVLAVPPYGSVNVHASLLPELRGAAPIQWAVIRGHERTGVSIMRMEAGLDSGPVLFQVPEPIHPDDSASDLYARLAEVGAEALIDVLAMFEAGKAAEQAQDHACATYAPKVDRTVARLDWTRPAKDISRLIRGMDAVPGAWSDRDGTGPVKLFRPRVESADGKPGQVLHADDTGVLIATGDGAVRVGEVQPPGKRRMTAGDWVRGRGVLVGDRFL